MAEFLGSASSTQLLMCMAGPMVGAIILVGVLFVFFARYNKKQQMKLGSQPKAALAGEMAPLASTASLSSVPLPLEPTTELNALVLPSNQLSPPGSMATSASPAEPNLNLDLLSHQVETETDMMNPSQSPNERKAGLSARLANRTHSAPTPAKPEAKQEEIPGPAAPGLALKPASEPARQFASPSKPTELVELLRLLRDPQSGQLIVEIAGQRYTKLAEITDKEIGQYILKLVAHLLAFTNGMIATDAGLKSVPAPKVGETPMPLAEPTPVSQLPDPMAGVGKAQPAIVQPPFTPQPLPAVEAAFLASIQAKPVAVEPPQPQCRGLFGRSKPAPEAETLLPPLNLAGQINEIAQARLRYSPLATTTKLEITSDPGGGIQINVNGMVYHGPDDIPHPEVKELIKASIKEWERS